jgi:antitoxin ParD1/3/4
MEEGKSKLEALRAHLAQRAKQAETGDFVNDFSMGIVAIIGHQASMIK